MDLERFDEFRNKSHMLISSSNWVTERINLAIERAKHLPSDVDDRVIEDLLDEMDQLQLKANWEEMQHKRLVVEYKDIIIDDERE